MNNYVNDNNATTLMTNIGNKIKGKDITATASGSDDIILTDAANARVLGVTIKGRSEIVDGAIKSIGDAGWGVVDLGTLTWTKETSRFRSDTISNQIKSVSVWSEPRPINSKYRTGRVSSSEGDDKILGIYESVIYIRDMDYTDATAFKSAMSGVLLYYPLADASQADPLLGIISRDGAGHGTAVTLTTGLPLRSNGEVKDEIDLADGVAITRIDSNGDVLATPVTTPLSDAEKAAFAKFRTFNGSTNVTATDNPLMSMVYVKNTENGKAFVNVDDRINDLDISGKVDKVSSATDNNFAALDANGNLKDSGKKASDFVAAVEGKGLSTEDFTTAEKTKLASLSGGSAITITGTLTLTVAGWDTTTKQQTVLTTIDTSKRNVIDITVGELPTWSECNVYAISESATGVTFQCDTIPSDALTFKITSMEVTSNAG